MSEAPDAPTRDVPLLMPKMSMTMEEGEVISWHAAEGDEVSVGDIIAEVMTDKVDMDVEAPVDGVLVRIVAGPRSTVQVGSPMAFIRTKADDLLAGLFDEPGSDPSAQVGEQASAPADTRPRAAPDSRSAGGSERPVGAEPAPAATPASRRGPQPAVPFARRRAAELGVALASIVGSGPNGLVTVEDVERAAQRSGEPSPTGPTDSSTGLDPGYADEVTARRRSVRSAVARIMTASALVPQFTVFGELDLEPLDRARGGIGWTTLLVRALARALRAHPDGCLSWDEAARGPGQEPEHLGVALAVDSAVGLLAPVLRDPDRVPAADLDAQVRNLIDRARTGRLGMDDLQGATTTLSNLGGFGVPSFTSLLTPPQSCAVSVGAIAPRPVVVGGGLAVRLGATIGLTVDHRTVDGADAARILAEIGSLVSDPDRLLP